MDNQKPSIDKLPVEIISHIFQFLSLKEKKFASNVCWLWYEASIHPRFIKNQVICLKDMDNDQIYNALKVYTKSSRAFFRFKICGFGVQIQDEKNKDDTPIPINKNHWVYTVWPLLAPKVIFLDFFDTVEFFEDLLPAMLNVTQQLKVLKIHNLQYSSKEELYKVNRLELLEELELDNLHTDNIDKGKLMGVIPKHLRKLSLKSLWYTMFIIDDLTEILAFCSSNLQILEFVNVDVTPELMDSISKIGMKLNRFSLVLATPMHYNHQPEIFEPLFKSQWPLTSLTISAECLTELHVSTIADVFINLEDLSFLKLPLFSLNNDCSTVPESLSKLRKLKYLRLG